MRLEHGKTIELQIIPPGSKFKKKIELVKRGNRLWLKFGYDKRLLDEIKTSFTGPKWHGFDDPPIKQWSVADCFHNWCPDPLLKTIQSTFLPVKDDCQINFDGGLPVVKGRSCNIVKQGFGYLILPHLGNEAEINIRIKAKASCRAP